MARQQKVSSGLPQHWELSDVRALLDRGDALLDAYEYAERDAPPLLAILALGAERLAMLTYGYASGDWPSLPTWQHRLVELDTECRSRMRADAPSEPVSELLDAVDADPNLRGILELLQAYGSGSRYHQLDQADSTPGRSPLERWRALLARVSRAHPEHRDYEQRDLEAARRAQRALNDELRKSLHRWRELYYNAWLSGACGSDAQRIAAEIQPNQL